MEDFLAALLAGLFELLAEVLFEVFLETICAFILRTLRKMFSATKPLGSVLAGLVYLLIGAAVGFVSVFILPHPLVHPSRLHGISLLISPVITGLIMSQIGSTLRRRGKSTVRLESFAYGFLFAFGVAAVRLAFIR